MKRAGVKSAILYTLCGQVLESVTNNPYLGVIFTDDLSFSMHVRQVCAKATRIYIRNCSQKLRKLAYTGMCRSVLEYASPIWDPYLQCDIDSLEHIQRKAARFTTRDFRQWSSVTAMMHDLQCEPLAERRTKTRVILMYLILNDEVAIPISPSILQPGRRVRFIQPAHHYQQYDTLTASTHEQSATGICYLQNSRTLPDWIASRTDYQSITTNLCCTGTSSSLRYLWGTSVYSAEKKNRNVRSGWPGQAQDMQQHWRSIHISA